MRKREVIIKDIKNLINTKGYIYALCMILFEDFYINPEKLQEINYGKRLGTKEASLLLGFLIQKEIDFSTPDTPQDLIQLKQKTYELMEELHYSFMIPFLEKLEKSFQKEHKKENLRMEQKEFFGKGDMLTEPIFYSGTGVYDFQYLDFLERKYKYDKKWLSEKKNFNIEQVKNIVTHIKNILEEKSKKVRLYDLKERLPQTIEENKKKNPNEDWEKHTKEVLPMMELYQYVKLFFEYKKDKNKLNLDDIGEEEWKSFYKELIELFVIRKSDFDSNIDIESFFNNFSISFEENLNSQFQTIGNFNLINACPIIKFDEERYFVPISFLLFEAVYESPFYWMIKDKEYEDLTGKNRGKVGEEITYSFLSKVFKSEKVFKSVKIQSPKTKKSTKKKKDDTDIDVLCILGSKALCVQVKSKKLTELSRMGNDEQLQKDFQEAVQDAYEQGIVSRQKILERNAKFIDESGNEIKLSEEIDEVYIMGITTENYPSLTHQAHVLLDKKDDNPFPIVLTIFDLELLTYYLNDPYDFLYYIRQRSSLMDYFKADGEMSFLGYHLEKKLWKLPKVDYCSIEASFAQSIDRNFYPIKAGINVSDEGDIIKNRWKNEEFNQLCNQLKTLNQAKITDIIFHLLDWSGYARKNLVNLLVKLKQQTLNDGKIHNFSMPPDDSYSSRVGVTYISLNSDNAEELRKKLLTLCPLRKYKSRGDVWIGFGSLNNSYNMIDIVSFNDQKWEYNEELEKMSKTLLEGRGQGRLVRIGKKIGRNEKCPCGSNLKYKKCCGSFI
ncbi:MAG: SEC-C domain-containing protein [Candidatus Aenigmarchaeota archaeon]|nr:SEC-C domain-containing protein [Candidatus Aenigmarchaeota archaeon]